MSLFELFYTFLYIGLFTIGGGVVGLTLLQQTIVSKGIISEEEKSFLDSHLTLTKLSRDCGLNRTYISVVLNESLGGFFNYINRCRLAHAETYKGSHPKADVDEIALSSGFNNRQSFYNARKRLNG